MLHLLAVFDALAVNDVVNVLNLVWANGRNILLRCGVTQDRLVDRRELVVLVRTSGDKSLLARVTSVILADVRAYATDLGQL